MCYSWEPFDQVFDGWGLGVRFITADLARTFVGFTRVCVSIESWTKMELSIPLSSKPTMRVFGYNIIM